MIRLFPIGPGGWFIIVSFLIVIVPMLIFEWKFLEYRKKYRDLALTLTTSHVQPRKGGA